MTRKGVEVGENEKLGEQAATCDPILTFYVMSKPALTAQSLTGSFGSGVGQFQLLLQAISIELIKAFPNQHDNHHYHPR